MSELERLELLLRRMEANKQYRTDIRELLLDLIEGLAALHPYDSLKTAEGTEK